MSIEHLPNRDAIYDLIAANQVAPLGGAMLWAHDNDVPEVVDLWTALFDQVKRQPGSDVGRAMLIVLDAWIESQKREVAA